MTHQQDRDLAAPAKKRARWTEDKISTLKNMHARDQSTKATASAIGLSQRAVQEFVLFEDEPT